MVPKVHGGRKIPSALIASITYKLLDPSESSDYLPRRELNRLRFPTVDAISGRVAKIVYMGVPIRLWYIYCLIAVMSSGVVGDKAAQWPSIPSFLGPDGSL